MCELDGAWGGDQPFEACVGMTLTCCLCAG